MVLVSMQTFNVTELVKIREMNIVFNMNGVCSLIFHLMFAKDYDVREYAISVAGRLSEKNPAYVLPALRRHLIQLLTYLEHR